MVTMCHLRFSYWPINNQTCYDGVFRHTVSEAAKLGVNGFPTIVYAEFESAIHNAVTTLWSDCEVKGCRFHLGHTGGGKYSLCNSASSMERKTLKSVLEENIRTGAFTTGGSHRLLCVGLYIQSSERQASGIVLRLNARKLC